ncbi:SGNH/GDSL hydrolase family protein [Verrucomicrobiales bacterium BCK34]|nr:SGNH/GDSL hydrolase family protein [Verrucomicrobiales bacterium BCK34]
MMNRRNFIRTGTSAVTAGVFTSAGIAAGKPTLESGSVILFQGDSITDAGRDKKNQVANEKASLGHGYPSVIGAGLLADHTDLDLQVYNRGISGHKVPDLAKRWDRDCIDLKPDVLSILIGVNDIWHKLNGRYDGTAEVYRDGFAALLERTQKALPDTTIVVCEPFVLKCGAVLKGEWFPEFDTRRAYAKEVATAAGTLWVPFQEMFDEAVAAGTEPEKWAKDGVHPSGEGHALMAKTWREVVGI